MVGEEEEEEEERMLELRNLKRGTRRIPLME